MTDSNFQSTAGQSFREPVNTFVKPVSVVQKSSLMDFAETLAEVNPTLQNFIAVKAKERAERTKEVVNFLNFFLVQITICNME